MLAPSGGGLILYQAYGNLYDMIGIKQRHRDLSSDGVKKLTTASGRNRLISDLEDSIIKQFDNTNEKSVGEKDNNSAKCDSNTYVGVFGNEVNELNSETNGDVDAKVRMFDVPLEAWSVAGISALTSSLVNPLIMNIMTANMCHSGLGRLNFSRVLVEMEADKEFKKTIEVQYKDSVNNIKGTKKANDFYARRWNGGNTRSRNTNKGKQTKVRHEQNKENSGLFWNKFVNEKQEYRKKQAVEKDAEKGKNDEDSKKEAETKNEIRNKGWVEEDVLNDSEDLEENVTANEIHGRGRNILN
nr:ATPase, F1/V1/A1 complex, alpha/beta subunit, zinc knuckle CX2CX4HX4C [Tanacetum cinerariifolium]GEZ11374.1 ATPase, F1/V1/A1 complex, alpha/beta subunit, zinc knuckle CX2CX4HX4C [Tanacetum cinerariifolium]